MGDWPCEHIYRCDGHTGMDIRVGDWEGSEKPEVAKLVEVSLSPYVKLKLCSLCVATYLCCCFLFRSSWHSVTGLGPKINYLEAPHQHPLA